MQPYRWMLDILASGASGKRFLLLAQHAPGNSVRQATIREISADGHQVFRQALPLRARPVTDGEWDSIVAFNTRGEQNGDAREAIRHALIRPHFHPVIARAILGRDATAWLQMEDIEHGLITWLVLSPTGQELGRATLASNITLLDANASMAVAVRNDSDDVPHVLVMPVHGITLH